jgi:hypothetical protein
VTSFGKQTVLKKMSNLMKHVEKWHFVPEIFSWCKMPYYCHVSFSPCNWKEEANVCETNTTKKRQVRITGGRSRHERNPPSRGYHSAVSAEEKIMHASKLHKKPKPIRGFKLQLKERIQQ